METRRLGHSGLQVSVVGLGCNNFGGRLDQEATTRVVRAALDQGVTLFDTADVYGGQGRSEELLGRALGAERTQVVLATKFGHDMGEDGKGASRAYIQKAVHASLRRLGTDYIDLYQLHTPDPHTPIEETLEALNELVQQGLVRAVGCSNLKAEAVQEADRLAVAQQLTRFTSCQDEYSLLVRDVEAELVPTMQTLDLGLLPYFPLASGLLTGKYRPDQPLPEGTRFAGSKGAQDRYMNERNWAVVEQLRQFAEGRGHTLLELAFSWLAAQPTVSSVIAGATRPEQVQQNVQAVAWTLSPEELAEVDRLTRPQAVSAD
ncbi:aldo/keto reductase [Deinococcus sonorensis]|uniref:Aldo/keto reductase n=2 Tax=Deinococcus sonorensis TaxID=309891 RepID=A0AAU7UDQ3_9DEIO